MKLEKRFRAVSPQLLTSDGGEKGQVTVADTCLFKVKQQIILQATGLDNLELEVKRIDSDTEMRLGPRSSNIREYTDLTAYTTGLASFIIANEQNRPNIPFEEFQRATYEEEPVVAWRNMLVNKRGVPISEDDPLPVDAILSIPGDLNVDIAHPTQATIVNQVVAAANTEFSIALPNDTKRFKVHVRNGAAVLKFAMAAGEIAADRYIKIRRGFWQEEGELDLPDNSRIYLECNKAGVTVELISWQL